MNEETPETPTPETPIEEATIEEATVEETIVEESPETTFPCPKCNADNERYIRYIPSGMLKCPTCKKILKRDSIPEEYIEEVPSGKSGRKPKKSKREKRFESRGEPRERELFKRVKTPAEIIEEILADHGAKEDFIDYVVKKAERRGGLYPEQLRDMLRNLNSGIHPKTKIEYIIGDFYEAMQAESMKARDLGEGRYYPPAREDRERRETYYPPTEEYQQEETFYPRYDHRGRRIPSERSRDRPEVSRRDLSDFESNILQKIDDRLFKKKEEDRFDKMLEIVQNQSEDIDALTTTVQDLKENPPNVPPPGKSDFEKSLEHTIERQDKRQEELMKLITSERAEHKEDIRDLRDVYTKKVDKLGDDLKDAEKGRKTTEGYTDDGIRLAADGLNRLADVAERKKPIEALVRIVSPEGGEKPPKREKTGKSRIQQFIPPEMQE